jgi:hypothetical protein
MPVTPRAVLEDRWSRLQTMIRKEGVQALILCGRGKIGSYGNIHYVSSYYLYSVSSYAVLMPDGVPTLVLGNRDQEFARELGLGDFVPDFHAADFTSTMFRVAGQSAMGEQLVHVLQSKKLTAGPVGIVGLSGIMPVEDYLYVRKTLPDLELRDVTPAYSAVKAIKSRAEVALIEETYEIADAGFMCFVEQLALGKTEWEVCGEVEGTVRKRGARRRPYIFSEATSNIRAVPPRRYEAHDLIACFVSHRSQWDVVRRADLRLSQGAALVPGHRGQATACAPGRRAGVAARPGRWSRHSVPPSARPTGTATIKASGPGTGSASTTICRFWAMATRARSSWEWSSRSTRTSSTKTRTGAVFCEQYEITTEGARRFSRHPIGLVKVTR